MSKVKSDSIPPEEFEREAIHGYFGLSYANYLVVNRSLLQSMPDEWQDKFVKLLREFSKEFGWAMELQPAINVQILAHEPERLPDHEICPECDGSGDDPASDGKEKGDCPECDGDGEIEVEGDRFESPEEVGTITDPVPHYERGRTSVPRASLSIAEVDNGYSRLVQEWYKANEPTRYKRMMLEEGSEVEIIHHPSHILPPVLEALHGTFDGIVVKVFDDLCKVKVKPLDEEIVVQVHIDQLNVD